MDAPSLVSLGDTAKVLELVEPALDPVARTMARRAAHKPKTLRLSQKDR